MSVLRKRVLRPEVVQDLRLPDVCPLPPTFQSDVNRRESILSFLALSAAPASLLAAPEGNSPAQAAATDWLRRIDGGEYAASWQTAADMFKAAISAQAWEQAVQSARGPLGASRHRTETSARFTKSLPGVPDGRYVVIQFKSVFEKKADLIETVTVAQDTDGVWRVAGYFVR